MDRSLTSRTEPGPELVLALDQGNSSGKAYLAADGVKVASAKVEGRFTVDAVRSLIPSWRRLHGIVYSSVSDPDPALEEALGGMAERFVRLTHTTPMPVRIGYLTPSTLGLDRVAAACGAYSMYGGGSSALIVDAGTAMTVDVVDSDGFFRGGNISPGMSLRFRSLHEFTSRLPLVDPDGPVLDFGRTTEEAIRCGVVGGMVAEVAAGFRSAVKAFGCRHLVLTGGDAPILGMRLQRLGFSPKIEPDLVALGLLSIFNLNDNEEK